MRQIVWSRDASADRDDIFRWIQNDSPRAAVETDEHIEAAVDLLACYANLGRPGRIQGTRELALAPTPYVIAYRTSGEEILILRVLHGAQRWPKRF